MRDDFSIRSKTRLLQRVGGKCSNPLCRRPTSGPHEKAEGVVNIGVAAHISAAAAGGPRYDSRLTSEQRGGIGNGIWLCQNCAKLVDNDPERYSSDTLLEWKRDAEEAARAAVESGAVPDSPIQTVVQYFRIWLECVAQPFVFRQERLDPPAYFWIGNIVLAWLLAVVTTLIFQILVYGPAKLSEIVEFHRGSFAFVHLLFFVGYAILVVLTRSLAALFARVTVFRRAESSLEKVTIFFLGTTWLDPILCPIAAVGVLIFDYLNLAGPALVGRSGVGAYRLSVLAVSLVSLAVTSVSVAKGLERLQQTMGDSSEKKFAARYSATIVATLSSLGHYAIVFLVLYAMIGSN